MPYIFVLSMLTLLSVLTTENLAHFKNTSIDHVLFTQYRQKMSRTQEEVAKGQFQEIQAFKGDEKEEKPSSEEKILKKSPNEKRKRSYKLNYDENRPPNNARFNITLLFEKNSYMPKELSFETLFTRLVYVLFDSDLGPALVDELGKHKEKIYAMTYPDELAELTFSNPKLQKTFHEMLSDKLLDYLSCNPKGKGQGERNKLNLLFADPLLIELAVENASLAQALIEARNETWHYIETIENKSIGRKEIKMRFKNTVENLLKSTGKEDYTKVFDYSLGKSGNILLIEDPLTGKMTRKKLPPLL